MKGDVGEVVSKRAEPPEGKVRHEANGNQGPIDLGRLSYQRLPKGAGENLRQVPPVFNEKILDDESPVVPDEEIGEAVGIKKNGKAGDSQDVDPCFPHVLNNTTRTREAVGRRSPKGFVEWRDC